MNSHFPVRIIALDLDDTLLKDDLTISDYTVSVMQKAVKKEIYVVLCSGRTENAILPYVRRLDIAGSEYGRFMISQNGATIYDMHTRTAPYLRTVDAAVLVEALHKVQDAHLSCEVYDASTIYAPVDNDWIRVDKKLSGLNLRIVDNFEQFLSQGFPKMVIPGEPEELQKLQTELKAHFGDRAVIFTSKPYFLEILPARCGKGEALKELAENMLHIPHEYTMAFGDSMNDESMIRYAAHSTAMCNGLDYIKGIAAHVTDKSNDQDGAAYFIEEHCL